MEGRPPVAAPVAPRQPRGRKVPQRRSLGVLGNLFSYLLLAAVIAVIFLSGYIYSARPSWAAPILAPLTNLMATSTPTVLTSQEFETSVTIQVPSGASDAQIRSALQAAFAAAAQAQYGAGTLVNQNVPPSPIGSAVQVGGPDAGMVTYEARMRGFIYTP
ncbi:MAG: hypothetical protein HGB28_01910 [Oscillochloris sp.]|nr:hypothetical protein [Oscillochloris sp.]